MKRSLQLDTGDTPTSITPADNTFTFVAPNTSITPTDNTSTFVAPNVTLMDMPYDIIEVVLSWIPFGYLPMMMLVGKSFTKTILSKYLEDACKLPILPSEKDASSQRPRNIPRRSDFSFSNPSIILDKFKCIRNIIGHGDLKTLKSLWRYNYFENGVVTPAYKYGHVHIVDYMYYTLGYIFTNEDLTNAINHGNKKMVYYMMDRMHLVIETNFSKCIRRGHFDLFLDLLKNNKIRNTNYEYHIAHELASMGNMDGLKAVYAIDNAISIEPSYIVRHAVDSGQYMFAIQFVDFCIHNKISLDEVMEKTVLQNLVSLHINRPNFNASLLCGLLDTLIGRTKIDFVFLNYVPNLDGLDYDVFSFLIDRGAKFPQKFYIDAAKKCKFDLIKTAFDKFHTPVPPEVYTYVAKACDIQMMRWLCDNCLNQPST